MGWIRRDTYLLLLVTLLAAGLRFYQLGIAPPGFQFDEAFNAIDAEQVYYGNRPLFLPANGGREALYTYYQAALGTLLGFNVYSLRLASALAGIATIPATYWLLRTMLRRRSRLVAFFTSLALTISFWHLHFSHYGIRVILMPLLLSALIGSFWLALHGTKARTRWLALIGAGLLTGLAPWTHPAGRFVPFILAGYVGWLVWRGNALPGGGTGRRALFRHTVLVLVAIGSLAFLVFLPLGIEFYRHPDFFFGHASEVSIFAERVSGESHPWRLLRQNLLLVLGMFNLHGDVEWAHNIPGRPVFEWPLGLAFVLGVIFWIGRLIRRRSDDPDVDALALLTVWTAIMLLPSILSEAAPNYSRTLPALPAAFVPVGLALAWLVEWPDRWQSRQTTNRLPRWSGYVVAALLFIVSGSWAFVDYFVRYPQMPESYYIYDTDKLDALAALEGLAAAGNTIYLAPLWSEHATFRFLRDTSLIKSLDSGETVVLPPPGQGAVYAFPAEKHERAADLAMLWPNVDVVMITDRYDEPLLATVQVSAAVAAQWPTRYEPDRRGDGELPAYFDDAPTLIGVQQRNNRQELRLFWRAEAPTLRNLTAFLHLIDQDGHRVAQADKLPGDGSYLTPTWSVGERVIERYAIDFADHCYGEDPLMLMVGWYELAADGARRPRLDAAGNPLPGDSANAGTITFPIVAQPPEALTLPPAANLTIGDGLILYGYVVQFEGVAAEAVQAGGKLSIDLYWQATDALNTESITVQLRTGEEARTLWQDRIAPDVPWHDGEVICRRVHVTIPADLTAGDYPLEVATTANGRAVPFQTVKVAR